MLTVPTQSQAAEDEKAVAAAARDVLRRHCLRCHSGPGSDGGDFHVLQANTLYENDLVDKSTPDESLLLQRVIDGEMPPASIRKQQPVTDEEIQSLQAWIRLGSPAFTTDESRPTVAIESVLTAVTNDLRQLPRSDRHFTRYFTLHHLQNTPAILTRDLPMYRAALAKSLNSLSWHPRLALPRAVSVVPSSGEPAFDGILYAIDIRRLQWSDSVWNRIETRYPYGVSFSGSDNESLQHLAEELEAITSVSLPVIRADWFAATATRGELYYEILDLPQNESHLLAQLQVDPESAFLNPHFDLIARAGFSRSGVSAQNRLVERLVGRGGVYWRSFDFGPDAGRGKLTRFPLGPVISDSPFNRLAFQHDGGEIIFALPNGLHAYVLVDANGDRISVGPIHIVNDALKTSGNPAIVNAVSCFACHKHGINDVSDTLRDGSVVEGDALQHVRKLHPELSEMNELVQADRENYMDALEQTIGPYLPTGDDDEHSLQSVDEPIGHVARQHRLVFLDLATIAAELETTPDELLRMAGTRQLRRLGLEDVTRGGVISRAEWEATDQGVSLMQQVARLLRLTPITPL